MPIGLGDILGQIGTGTYRLLFGKDLNVKSGSNVLANSDGDFYNGTVGDPKKVLNAAGNALEDGTHVGSQDHTKLEDNDLFIFDDFSQQYSIPDPSDAAQTINVSGGGGQLSTKTATLSTLKNYINDSLVVATSSIVGGIKIGYSTDASNRNYAVQLDSNKAFVNVPWTDTNTQLSTEDVQDIAGPLVATGGTKTGISVTYDDTNNNMDFVVSDLTVASDSGSTGMTPGDTLTITGGTNVTTAMSGDTLTITSTNTNTQLSDEQVQDIVGAMFTSNTETRISATYQDSDGTIDLAVDAIPVDLTVDGAGTIHANNVPTLNQNTSGTAAGLSATLAVNKGGTGATTLTSTGILLGNGTSAIQASSNIKVTSDILTIKNEESDSGGVIKFLEGSDNGSHATVLQSTDNLGSNITVNLPNSSGTLALTSGSVATLTNARTIGGVSFNGSANIDLPGVNTNGNQSIEYTPTISQQAAGNNSAIIIKEGSTTTVAGKVYYLAPNGSWVLANAGAEGTRSGLLGVAVGTNSTSDGMVVKGLVTISTHATSGGVGKTVYLHTTDGLMTTTAPSSVRILGSIVKHHSNRCEVYFNPDNFNGQAVSPVTSSFTDNKSLLLDGLSDYAMNSNLSGIDNWGKSEGTLSVWVNLNITDDNGKNLISFYDGDNTNFGNFLIISYFKVSSSRYALVARQRRTESGTIYNFNTVAQQSSANHGRPFQRTAASFTSIQENYNSIRTSDTWTHIVYTWDDTDDYDYNGVTYYGNQHIYVNGELKGFGTSTMPGHNAIGTAVTTGSNPPNRSTSFTHLVVGSLNPLAHGLTNMKVNDLAIWNTALSSSNVTAIYNSSSSNYANGSTTDLLTNSGNYTRAGDLAGYWKFEDNLNDSKNSNHLTGGGSPTFDTSTP